MSLVKIKEVGDISENPEGSSSELIQCCDKHFLVNSRIPVNDGENVNFINFRDINTVVELQQMRAIAREKDNLIVGLERENVFLREQVKTLNTLLDQLSISTRNLATRNDIRIKVENSSNLTFKKWYRRPKVILSGSAIAVLFSIYLRYKIKNW